MQVHVRFTGSDEDVRDHIRRVADEWPIFCDIDSRTGLVEVGADTRDVPVTIAASGWVVLPPVDERRMAVHRGSGRVEWVAVDDQAMLDDLDRLAGPDLGLVLR